MSIKLTNAGDYYHIASYPNSMQPATYMMYVMPDVATSAIQTLFEYAGSSNNNTLMAISDNDQNFITYTSGGAAYGALTISFAGVWYHACHRIVSAASQIGYINGSIDVATADVWNSSQDPAPQLGIGHSPPDTGASRQFKGKIAHLKIWTVALSESDIAIEKAQAAPTQNLGNLYDYWALATTAGLTGSVNSNTLTSHGSPSTDGGEPFGGGTGLMWL